MTQGYAYEIRFVDDNKVQVFDLARRHVDPTSATLPTEYKAEEVLRGDLRYSKLLGTQQNATQEQWEHITYTKRGRRSIQRHTFMMGSHSTEHDAIMDLEVGNKDTADIRFNENNICQNNPNTSINATDENSLVFSTQSTSPDSSFTDTNGSSPDRSQSMHFKFEEDDMTNVLKKSTFPMHKNTSQSVTSQALNDTVIEDSDLKISMQKKSSKKQKQHSLIESGYSINSQQEKMSLSPSRNNKEDTLDINDNQSNKQYLNHNSFEYSINGTAMKSSIQHKNESVSKFDRESNNNEIPIQTQRVDRENAYQNEQHCDNKHQMNQVLSNTEAQKNHSSYIHTISNEKVTCYSTNTPIAYNNGDETLTRIKSVSLENYEASPERSCCIIS